MSENQVWTIGHSNRELSEVLGLLASERIEVVADVRRFPGSRRHPQFGGEAFAAALKNEGIAYRHYPELGGRRSKRLASSPNTGWRVAAFGAYADYMLTEEFGNAVEALAEVAAGARVAIMCSESLPWRCHRRLIADQFVVRGWNVQDIVGAGQVRQHALPPFAEVRDGQVYYPGEAG